MSMVDDENTGAIDTGENYTPPRTDDQPAGDPQAAGVSAGAIDAPPPAAAGLPDMGPPPYGQQIAQETPGQGLAAIGNKIGADVKEGIHNVAQTAPVNVAKRIVSYLMGSDAEDTAGLEQAAAKVDPQGQLSPDDRNLLAVHQAHQEGGEQAAWKLMQANRVAYNAKQAFAQTALNGIQGKPADINAAATAATQAASHILDGSSVNFQPNPQGGVTATVKMPSGQPTAIDLTVPQFNQWLNVGGDGQWDKVMENGGASGSLQKIAQGQGEPLKGPAPQAGAPQAGAPQQGAAPQPTPQRPQPFNPQGAPPSQTPATPQQARPAPPRQPMARDVTQGDQPALPGQFDVAGHAIGGQPAAKPMHPDEGNYGDELQLRSEKIFPSAGQEAQRQQWMAAQESKTYDRKMAMDVAHEKGINANERARITGTANQGREEIKGTHQDRQWDRRAQGVENSSETRAAATVEAARGKAIQAAQKMEQTAKDNDTRERGRMVGRILANPNAIFQTPEQIDAVLKKFGVSTGAAAPPPSGAPAPGNAPPPARGGGQNPPGTKMFNGKLYTRGPNGESVPYQQ